MNERVLAAMARITDRLAAFNSEERIVMLSSLLMQEVCLLPVSERVDAIHDIQRDLPMIFRASEEGMRQALVENARDGL